MRSHRTAGVFLLVFALAAGATRAEAAANYDLKTITPPVQQALEGRQDRFEQIQRYKAQGWIGETNNGYVADLKNAPDSASLVQSENNDRRVIYRAVVEQNNLGASGLAQVEKVFGEVQRERSRAGDRVQLASGQWSTK